MLSKLLIYLSGADPSIIKQCPEEKNGFLITGSSVLLTGSLSGLLMFFMLMQVNVSITLSTILSLVICLLQITTDRFVTVAHMRNRIYAAIPRILLGCAISLMLSQLVATALFTAPIKNTGIAGSQSTLLEKMQLLDSLGNKNSSIYWARALITITLVLLLNMTVIFNFLIPRKAYLFVLDARLNEAKRKLELETDYAMTMKINTERMKSEIQMQTNEKLMRELAAKQRELAERAIDKWYMDELQNILSNN